MLMTKYTLRLGLFVIALLSLFSVSALALSLNDLITPGFVTKYNWEVPGGVAHARAVAEVLDDETLVDGVPNSDPFYNFSRLGSQDQIDLMQSLSPKRASATASATFINDPTNGNSCLTVKPVYTVLDQTEGKLWDWNLNYQVCYKDGQVVSENLAENSAAPTSPLWSYNGITRTNISGGGVGQAYIEKEIIGDFKLCVLKANAGCVEQSQPVMKIRVNTNGTFNIQAQ
ncbi:MAG: hypothetical protein OHK0017_01820 [Patescibacteria group bacterium]